MDRRTFLALSAGATSGALSGCPDLLRRWSDDRPKVFVSSEAVSFVPNASLLTGQVRATGFDASGFGNEDTFAPDTGRFTVLGTDTSTVRFEPDSLRGLAFTVDGRPCDVFRNGTLLAERTESFSRRFGGEERAASTPSGTDGATPGPTGPGFVTDFEFGGEDLDDRGWQSTGGEYTTRDSLLVSTGGAQSKYVLYRDQPIAAGRFEYKGVRNPSTFYGLKTLFVSDTRRFGPARGYGVTWRQSRRGDVNLVRHDGESSEVILKLTENHRERATDVTVVRNPSTHEFEAFLDGESVGTVRDATYTTSRYWVQRHNNYSMTVDGLAARPPG